MTSEKMTDKYIDGAAPASIPPDPAGSHPARSGPSLSYIGRSILELDRRARDKPDRTLILNKNSMFLDPENRCRPWFLEHLFDLEDRGLVTVTHGPRSELHIKLTDNGLALLDRLRQDPH